MQRSRKRSRSGTGASKKFSPSQLTGLTGWYDPSDTSSITSSGGSVSQINDKSGSANHATQGTAANQPITGTRTINGLNSLDFDGSNDNLVLPPAMYPLATGAWTYFAVFQSDVSSGAARIVVGSTAGTVNHGIYGFGYNARQGTGQTAITPYSTTNADLNGHIYVGRRSGTFVEAFGDNGDYGSLNTAADAALSAFVIGSSASTMDGRLGEVIMYNRALTDAEVNQIGAYLQSKWGIAWTARAFNPLYITDFSAWYDASDARTITQVANVVSQWGDKSGFSRHATQATGAAQPTTGGRTVNGLNALNFDGSNDRFDCSGDIMHSAAAMTCFAVCQSDFLASTDRRVFQFDTPASTGDGYHGMAVGQATTNMYTAVKMRAADTLRFATGTAQVTTNPFIGHSLVIGSNAAGANNFVYTGQAPLVGAGLTANAYPASGMTGVIGALNTSGAAPFDGAVCEMIFYKRALTTAERNQIGNYLAAKWGITWTALP